MQYQILLSNITIFVWSVWRTNDEILGVNVFTDIIITSNYSSPEKGGRRILFGEGRWGSHGFRGTRNGDQSLLAEYKEKTLLSVSLVAPIFSLLPSFLP